MNPSTVSHDTLVIERIYDAPVPAVFRAWAEPARKAVWFAGSPEALGTSYHLDFSVGGREVNRGGPPGGPEYVYTAEFRDIVDNARIVATTEMLADRTRLSVTVVTVEFEGAGATTRLLLTEQCVFLDGHETAEQREHGTRAQLESLAASLAGGA